MPSLGTRNGLHTRSPYANHPAPVPGLHHPRVSAGSGAPFGTAPSLLDSWFVRIRSLQQGCSHAEAFPAQFRRDVVAVARKHEAPISQIAKDFGISEATLPNWLKKADIEEGAVLE